MRKFCPFCAKENDATALTCQSCKRRLDQIRLTPSPGAPKPPPSGVPLLRPSSPAIPVAVKSSAPESPPRVQIPLAPRPSPPGAMPVLPRSPSFRPSPPVAMPALSPEVRPSPPFGMQISPLKEKAAQMGEHAQPPPPAPPPLATIADPPSQGNNQDDLVARGVHIGNFKLIKVLGFGGMGAVYLGEHIEIGKRVAIKVLKPEFAAEKEALSRFLSEARLVTRLHHPSIVDVYDCGVISGIGRYLIMEYLEGTDLHQHIQTRGALSPYEGASIAWQILDALEAAHDSGVIHRDLKPSNVYLVRWGRRTLVKLLDFGVAKLLHANPDEALMTRTGVVVGTPAYMAPEQAAGAREPDSRMDLYSFGVILFEMVTGRRPFISQNINELMVMQQVEPAPPPSAFAPGIHPDLEKLILRCLEKIPEDRPPSARVLKEELGRLLPSLSRQVLSSIATPLLLEQVLSEEPAGPSTPSYGLPSIPASEEALSKKDTSLTAEAPLLLPNEVDPTEEDSLLHPPQLITNSDQNTQPLPPGSSSGASPPAEAAKPSAEEKGVREGTFAATSTSYIRMQELRAAVLGDNRLHPKGLASRELQREAKQEAPQARKVALFSAGGALGALLLALLAYFLFLKEPTPSGPQSISLGSIPQGAQVIGPDGAVWGVTPLSIAVPTEGITLRLKAEGFLDITLPLTPQSPPSVVVPLPLQEAEKGEENEQGE